MHGSDQVDKFYFPVTGDHSGGMLSLGGMVIPGLSQAKLGMKAAKVVTRVESKVFLVTKEGVALLKGAIIPSEFIENANRSSTYGIMENGKFVEKLRIDPARFAEPSHFHINGKGKKLTIWRWF